MTPPNAATSVFSMDTAEAQHTVAEGSANSMAAVNNDTV